MLCPPGKTDITSMLLDAGAETDLVNSVGRTAAQMAAFVGEAPVNVYVSLRFNVRDISTFIFSSQVNMTAYQ